MKSKWLIKGLWLILLQGCVAAPSEVQQGFFLNPSAVKPAPSREAEESSPQKRGDHLDYLLFSPQTTPGKTYRLLLALHGAGENMTHYLEMWTDQAAKTATFVVVPQLDPSTFLFNGQQDASLYFNLLEFLKERYPIDPKRIYIEGASVGGGTAKWLVNQNPEYWRGGIFVSSVGFLEAFDRRDPNFIDQLVRFPPLLYVQGLKDTDNLDFGLEQIGFLIEHGVKVQLHSYENAGHEHRPEWNQRIFEWMDRVEKKDKSH